jgi:type III pantothenate kinase
VLLALDIGNSQTSFGVFDGRKLLHHWRAETKVSRTSDEYAALLFPLLDHVGLKQGRWESVVVCSVVPSAEQSFEQFCQDYLKISPFKIHSRMDLGLVLNVEVPGEVGADRLANAAYASRRLQLPAIVVDLGTATTFDVVSKEKVYEGGIILPGVRMGAEALSHKTSKLPLVDIQFPASIIGKSTVECLRSGILFGYCEMMDGLLERLVHEVGQPCDVALTGGLSAMFHQRLRTRTKLLPDLTLEGAVLLYFESVGYQAQ